MWDGGWCTAWLTPECYAAARRSLEIQCPCCVAYERMLRGKWWLLAARSTNGGNERAEEYGAHKGNEGRGTAGSVRLSARDTWSMGIFETSGTARECARAMRLGRAQIGLAAR